MQSAVWEQRPFASRLSQPLTTLCVCLFFFPFPLASFFLFLFLFLPLFISDSLAMNTPREMNGRRRKGSWRRRRKERSWRKRWPKKEEKVRKKGRERKRERERERKERLNQLEQISQSHKSIDAIAAPRPSAGKVQVSHGVSLALVSLMKRQ